MWPKNGAHSAPFTENCPQQRRPKKSHLGGGYTLFPALILTLELPGPHAKQLNDSLWKMRARHQKLPLTARTENHWSLSYCWAVTLYGSGKHCTEFTIISVFFIISSTFKCLFFAFHWTMMGSHNRIAFKIYLDLTGYLHSHNSNYNIQSLALPYTAQYASSLPKPNTSSHKATGLKALVCL